MKGLLERFFLPEPVKTQFGTDQDWAKKGEDISVSWIQAGLGVSASILVMLIGGHQLTGLEWFDGPNGRTFDTFFLFTALIGAFAVFEGVRRWRTYAAYRGDVVKSVRMSDVS